MKYRCEYSGSTRFENYGGRSISVCDRWHDFQKFKEDMYDTYKAHVEKFGEKQTTLDRTDNNGNYEPANCKWATLHEQAINARPRKLTREMVLEIREQWRIRPKGFTQRELSEKYSISRRHIGDIINRKKWSYV